ncbi:GNAT family N-acetyltransferase [Paenibacillus chartarius]|uniref:GNAT family N-acetyltransferase n=1 Tax=Paenibacillus chartarius TaxID=747481 RepID=A0ABV6DK61_9BACL
MMGANIRPAQTEEATILSDIAIRSKAYWGYDPEYMECAKKDLSISEENILDNWIFVIEAENTIRGFYELRENSKQEAELFWLFVDPTSIGAGYGKKLMKHAIQLAMNNNFIHIRIKSDPNAEGFYKGFGAIVVGESPSTVRPDMKLPVMSLRITQV